MAGADGERDPLERYRRTETHTPVRTGVTAGAAAFVLGWLVTLLLTGGALAGELFGQVVATVAEPAGWQVAGWLYLNAHLVAANVAIPGSEVRMVSFLGEQGPAVLYALPPVVLFAAGAAAGLDRESMLEPKEGLYTGLTVPVGYFPVAVATAFLTRVGGANAFAGPDPIGAVLFAGVAYPLVFGVGGAIAVERLRAGRLRPRERPVEGGGAREPGHERVDDPRDEDA